MMRIKNDSGFTLIEIIVTLVLAGIMATLGGMFLVQAIRGYMMVQGNTQISQQAQLAMTRIGREIMEMQDMTADGTATTLSVAHVAGNRTLGLDDGKIKINSTGGALSGGDILLDNVQNLTLTYWSGNPPASSSTWPVANDLQLLAAGEILVHMIYPGGGLCSSPAGSRRATTRIWGGAPAPTATPPSVPPGAGGCVVATAAYGYAYHPYVHVLRNFRDRYLLTWQGGRMLTDIYYTRGAPIADWLRVRPGGAAAVRVLLLPVIGMAFVAVYAPAGLLFLPALSLVLAGILHRRRMEI
jgi:prepilin-type N-terminal cleavage/methylation domain-containing protein